MLEVVIVELEMANLSVTIQRPRMFLYRALESWRLLFFVLVMDEHILSHQNITSIIVERVIRQCIDEVIVEKTRRSYQP
jgi:ethanolamine utilization protein EutA (predicted chaperonin)